MPERAMHSRVPHHPYAPGCIVVRGIVARVISVCNYSNVLHRYIVKVRNILLSLSSSPLCKPVQTARSLHFSGEPSGNAAQRKEITVSVVRRLCHC